MKTGIGRVLGIGGAVLVLAVAVVIVAVSLSARQPAGQAAASAIPTTQSATTVPATAVATHDIAALPTAEATKGSSPSEDELGQSDTFWDPWMQPLLGHLTLDSETLAEATEQADLIVLGRMSDLYVGEQWTIDDTSYPLDYAKIEVAEILKGEPHWRTPGLVEVQMGNRTDLEELRAMMPTHDYLWFLMYEPTWAPREDSPMASAEIAPYAYFASNQYQGVFRDIGGSVRLLQPEQLARILGPDHFPLELEGASFDQIVGDVRELVK